MCIRDSFRTVASSRAFPGWTAGEIHRALNERGMSAVTRAALHRVGAVMGAARGTGPDDDPWLRHYRDESRHEAVLAALAERGIATTPALPGRMSQLGDVPVTRMMRAALRCGSEAEFLDLCAARPARSG